LALALGFVVQVQLHRVQFIHLISVHLLLPPEVQNPERINEAIYVRYLSGGLFLGDEAEGDGAVLPTLVPVKLAGGDNLQNRSSWAVTSGNSSHSVRHRV